MINLNDPILGDAGTLIRNQMQSEGFVSGSNGWRIERNGNAEFNDVTIRGDLITGPPGSKHLEILDGSNSMDFYSGDADEVANGYINVDVVGNSAFVDVVAPDIDPATFLPAFMRVRNYDDGTSDATLAGGKVYVSETGGTLQTGVDSGDGTNAVYWFRSGAGWQTATLGANWSTNGGFTTEFIKDSSGTVHCHGRVQGTAAAVSPIFTFPVGYRPQSQPVEFLIQAGGAGGVGWIRVDLNGNVTILANLAGIRTQGSLTFAFSCW